MPRELIRVEVPDNEHDVRSRVPRVRTEAVLRGMQVGGSWIRNGTVIQRIEHRRLKTSTEVKVRVPG